LRFQIIDAAKMVYSLPLLCKVMKVSHNGFYSWKTRQKSTRQQEWERLVSKVKEISRQTKASDGVW
jgi:hypothetical protein